MENNTGINPSLYPRWDDSCIWKPQDDGLFILRISEQLPEQESSEPYHALSHTVLNREGKDTWMLCTGENTIHDIVKALQKVYEGDFQTIFQDVMEMISLLLEEEYLVLEQSPNPASPGLDLGSYLCRSDDVIANVVEDNFVIMNMKTSEVHSFEKTTEYLWEICDSTHTAGEIVSSAAHTEETAFLLNFLVRLGLLKVKD